MDDTWVLFLPDLHHLVDVAQADTWRQIVSLEVADERIRIAIVLDVGLAFHVSKALRPTFWRQRA